MITVTSLGRFGNNVLQLLNAIHIAQHLGHDEIRFNMPYFKSNKIVINKTAMNKKNLSGDFFYLDKYYTEIPGFEILTYEKILSYAKIYLLPIIKYKKGYLSALQLNLESTLFIHIRSGDIFGPYAHGNYLPAPLDYYELIIISKPWSNVFVVYEDDKNPVVNKMKQKHPNFIYKSLNLSDTMSVFFEAKHIVGGFGTFVPGMLLFNNAFTSFYLPEYAVLPFSTFQYPQIKLIAVPDYIPDSKWVPNKENFDKILNYIGCYFL